MTREDNWKEFTTAITARLEAGRREYGNSSFTRPLPELADEVMEELLDVCGWSYLIWLRVQRLKEEMGAMNMDRHVNHYYQQGEQAMCEHGNGMNNGNENGNNPATSTRYHLEIYEPGSHKDMLKDFESDTPFLPIHTGEIINPHVWFDVKQDMSKTLRVVNVQHIIWEGVGGVVQHKSCVYTEEVGDTGEMLAGLK